MHSSAKQVVFKDYVFNVSEYVYEPAEDSFLFAEYLLSESGKYVLDMGTGCGILGVIAAASDSRVVAVDINPYAVRCAHENAKLNHVADKFSFIRGDLFGSMKTNVLFDLILFNAPYLPTNRWEGKSWLEHAWAGGTNGRRIIDKFISQSSSHLLPRGRVLLLQSTLSGIEKTLKSFNGKGLRTRTLAVEDLPFFESILLIEARH
ncbi:MAG TPA: HemK2/MTQ2 family protein methyltransferase [Candidatus Acidoferrum sp.]|nr:HemK2/MTQ2 family protein methyltransferase [Candidatus Acidoferrum sp.]